MHHVILERWSRGQSCIHRRDARAKLAALLVFLVIVATTPVNRHWCFPGYLLLVVAAALLARLPLAALFSRSALVLPFTLVFAGVSWWSGEAARAGVLVARGYISASAVLVLVASTPLNELLRALSWFRVPSLLILVSQFVYRYLFVLSEQAQHMRLAAACRTGTSSSRVARRSRFRGAAGALSVLFARSYLRADGINRAMLSRGFSGSFPALNPRPLGAADAMFLILALAGALVFRMVV